MSLSSGRCQSCVLVGGQCGRLVQHGFHSARCFECLHAALLRCIDPCKTEVHFPQTEADKVLLQLMTLKKSVTDSIDGEAKSICRTMLKMIQQTLCHEVSQDISSARQINAFPESLVVRRTLDSVYVVHHTEFFFINHVCGECKDPHEKATPPTMSTAKVRSMPTTMAMMMSVSVTV